MKHFMRLGEELKRTEEIEQPREPLGNRQFGEHSTQATKTQKKTPKPWQTQKSDRLEAQEYGKRMGKAEKSAKSLTVKNKC